MVKPHKKARKKKESEDFRKPKIKVGKSLPKNLNVTKVSLETRKLQLRIQLADQTEATTDRKKRSVADLLIRLAHVNENIRLDSIAGLSEIISGESEIANQALEKNFGSIIRKLSAAMCDFCIDVRKSVCGLFQEIFRKIPESHILGHFPVMLTHLCSALAHVENSIQVSALKVLYLILDKYGNLAAQNSSKIIPILVHIVASKRSGTSMAKLNISTTGASGLLEKQLEVMGRIHQFFQLIIGKHNATYSLNNETEQKSNNESLVSNYFKDSSILFSSLNEQENEINEVSLGLITLSNVIFQLWSSAEAEIDEVKAKPLKYEELLASIKHLVDVIGDLFLIFCGKMLPDLEDFDVGGMFDNFSSCILTRFPFHVISRGQKLKSGDEVNASVCRILAIPQVSRNLTPEAASGVLNGLNYLLENSKDEASISNVLDCAKAVLGRSHRESASKFMMKYLNEISNYDSELLVRIALQTCVEYRSLMDQECSVEVVRRLDGVQAKDPELFCQLLRFQSMSFSKDCISEYFNRVAVQLFVSNPQSFNAENLNFVSEPIQLTALENLNWTSYSEELFSSLFTVLQSNWTKFGGSALSCHNCDLLRRHLLTLEPEEFWSGKLNSVWELVSHYSIASSKLSTSNSLMTQSYPVRLPEG